MTQEGRQVDLRGNVNVLIFFFFSFFLFSFADRLKIPPEGNQSCKCQLP